MFVNSSHTLALQYPTMVGFWYADISFVSANSENEPLS